VVVGDFYRHEVWNNTDQQRVVLIFDFDRPMGTIGQSADSYCGPSSAPLTTGARCAI
jgi:hypothetical protein